MPVHKLTLPFNLAHVRPGLNNESVCLMQTAEWPREGELVDDGCEQTEKKRFRHYLNEASFYELLISGKKTMIDLREDHLSRCVRSKIVGQR